MKKFVKISFGLVVTGAFVLGFIQFVHHPTPNVGWNGGPTAALIQDNELAFCQTCLPVVQPSVGWNT